MKTEFEIKILDINISQITKKLLLLGAKELGTKQQRRYVYNIKEGDEACWLRLRDNGEKVELTYKQIDDDSITGTKEVEIVVSEFDLSNELLEKLGFAAKAYQENKRTSFELDDVQIEIDEWPKIKPYLEVEGKNEEKVYAIVEKLGYTRDQTTSINTKKLYSQNGIDLESIKDLRF